MVTVTVKAGDPPPPMPESPVRGQVWWASCGAAWGVLAGFLAQGGRVVGGADHTFTSTFDVLGWELFIRRSPMADPDGASAFAAVVATAVAVGFGLAGAVAGLAARSLRGWAKYAEPGAAADGGA